MDLLKNLFPFSFTKKEDVKSLVIMVVLHIVAAIVLAVVAAILGFIPIVGAIIGVLASLIDLYITAGIVFTFLNYFKVGPFKD